MINARGRHPFMNLIEKWHQNGVISLEMPETAQFEAEAGDCAHRTLKAWSYTAPLLLITTAAEKERVELIERLLCGAKPMSKSDRRDALIVFTSVQWHAILITADGASNSQPRGILGAATELRQAVGAQIMSAADAVKLIRREISARDNRARCLLERGQLRCLPAWVGKDS